MSTAENPLRLQLANQNSKLLSLPTEIKNIIYKYALLSPKSGNVPEHVQWRGTTNLLALCCQTCVEARPFLHNEPVHISISYHGRKKQKPSVFRKAKDWKTTVRPDPRFGDRKFTIAQFRMFPNPVITICYFEWLEWPIHMPHWAKSKFTLVEELNEHLKQLKRDLRELVNVLRTCPYLETVTLQFVRWIGVAIDRMDPNSRVYPTMMSFCQDLVTFRPDVKFVAKSVTHWGPQGPFVTGAMLMAAVALGDIQGSEIHFVQGDQTAADDQDSEDGSEQEQQKIVTVPEREELLAPWFNQARQEWLASHYTANPPQQQNIVTATSNRIYNPFLGREKHMARREARRQERELKIDEGLFAETPTQIDTVELPPSITYRCKMNCCYYTTSRKAFRRHVNMRWHTYRPAAGAFAKSHSKKLRNYWRCPVCLDTFPDREVYEDHVLTARNYHQHWIDRDSYLYDARTLFDLPRNPSSIPCDTDTLPEDEERLEDEYKVYGIDVGFAPDFADDFGDKSKNMIVNDADQSQFPEFQIPKEVTVRTSHAYASSQYSYSEDEYDECDEYDENNDYDGYDEYGESECSNVSFMTANGGNEYKGSECSNESYVTVNEEVNGDEESQAGEDNAGQESWGSVRDMTDETNDANDSNGDEETKEGEYGRESTYWDNSGAVGWDSRW